MAKNFIINEQFFKKIFENVGLSLCAKNVDVSEKLDEQYSGVNFTFDDIPDYMFCFEFQEANFQKLMYGIKRIKQSIKNDSSTLEEYIKLNFHSHFGQKNEASKTSSFLVCAIWKFYKFAFCKGKSDACGFEKKLRELIENQKNFFHANEQTPWGFWKNDLNKQLLIEYKKLSLSNVSDATKRSLSCPMFIHLGLGYEKHEGVFFIGQETYDPDNKSGWGTPESVFGSRYYGFEKYRDKPGDLYSREGIMMETQSQWLFDNMCGKSRSHFFGAVKEISLTENGADFYYKSKFVWDELIAMDYNGKTLNDLSNEKEKKEVIEYSKKKLTMELDLLKPKFAIFFTGFGPMYKRTLEGILGMKIGSMSNKYGPDIKDANWNGIEILLTEHPRTLKKSGKWDVVDKLKAIVQ